MSIIGVTNLKEIKTWKGDLNILVILCKEEKCEQNWAVLGTNISRNTEVISFKFDKCSVYVSRN